MPKYHVTIVTPYYTKFEVEAPSQEEAEDLVADMDDSIIEVDSWPGAFGTDNFYMDYDETEEVSE